MSWMDYDFPGPEGEPSEVFGNENDDPHAGMGGHDDLDESDDPNDGMHDSSCVEE